MPITKSELIDTVAAKLNLPKARAEQILDAILESMIDTLKNSGGVEIRGFGSFSVREYKGYDGRNPRTGEPVKVQHKRLPFFKVGKELRQRVNDGVGKP